MVKKKRTWDLFLPIWHHQDSWDRLTVQSTWWENWTCAWCWRCRDSFQSRLPRAHLWHAAICLCWPARWRECDGQSAVLCAWCTRNLFLGGHLLWVLLVTRLIKVAHPGFFLRRISTYVHVEPGMFRIPTQRAILFLNFCRPNKLNTGFPTMYMSYVLYVYKYIVKKCM